MANDLWKYVGVVSHTKDVRALDDPEFESAYTPFIVNRALSYFEDSILAANMMNERPGLDKKLQALYLLNITRPRKRFSQWLKADKVSEDVLDIAEYYGCSQRHAKTLVSLHTPEQMSEIQRRLEKGGVTKKRVSHDTS